MVWLCLLIELNYMKHVCIKRIDLILLSCVLILSQMFPNNVQTQRDEEKICLRQIDRFTPAMAGGFLTIKTTPML